MLDECCLGRVDFNWGFSRVECSGIMESQIRDAMKARKSRLIDRVKVDVAGVAVMEKVNATRRKFPWAD